MGPTGRFNFAAWRRFCRLISNLSSFMMLDSAVYKLRAASLMAQGLISKGLF